MAPEAETKTVKAPQLELRGLDRVPEWFSHFIESNGLAHVLAHLVGLDGDQSRLLHCTADGNLYFEAAAGGAASVVQQFTAVTAPDTVYTKVITAGNDDQIDLGTAAPRIVRASAEGTFWIVGDSVEQGGPATEHGIVGNCASFTFYADKRWLWIMNVDGSETHTMVLQIWDL